MRLVVEVSWVVAGSVGDSSSARIFVARSFPQLHSPLVEGVDVPDDALGEDGVFVEGDELAEDTGVSASARIMLDGRLPSKTRCVN